MNYNSLNIIVAMTQDGIIGMNGKLPWYISDDLKNFKEITTGHGGNAIIMGKNTYNSIGKPLNKRINIVVSQSLDETERKKGIIITQTLLAAIDIAKNATYNDKNIFLIGGQRIYAEGLPLVNNMYITQIKKNYEGNIYFPKFNRSEWNIKKLQEHSAFELFLYKRKVQL
jgi:dihydrofolate reductase